MIVGMVWIFYYNQLSQIYNEIRRSGIDGDRKSVELIREKW